VRPAGAARSRRRFPLSGLLPILRVGVRSTPWRRLPDLPVRGSLCQYPASALRRP